eukprot:TRINITY_DN1197_c0_g1_i1.p1 TRINITY_DN1197_c0_g1~~TRINITY_DN1197_c0_g1_i1.p1  ORF type:complete len:498 (+),score=115.59 TRINITY_DN1197_c0_g1_i1:67-1560(+)
MPQPVINEDEILGCTNSEELQIHARELLKRLRLAYDVGTSKTEHLQEEMELLRKEKEVLLSSHHEEASRLRKKTSELASQNMDLAESLDQANTKLRQDKQNMSQLHQRVERMSNLIQERENKLWSFLFTESPFGDMGRSLAEDQPSTDTSSQAASEAELDAFIGLKHLKDDNISMNDLPTFEITDEIRGSLRTRDFNMWEYSQYELEDLLCIILEDMSSGLEKPLHMEDIKAFVMVVRKNYNNVKYHCWEHCFSVTQMMYVFIYDLQLRSVFDPVEILSLILSCLVHDLQHPGLNNAYQVAALTDLAIRYSDISPLENHHCATAYPLLRALLSGQEPELFNQIRKAVIDCVLATDMAKHVSFIGSLDDAVEKFDWKSPSDRLLIMKLLVKMSDVSNELRPWPVARPWADKLLAEFAEQTETEIANNLPVTEWMRTVNVVQPKMQLNFITHVLMPMYEAMKNIFPKLSSFCDRLSMARNRWQEEYNKYIASTEQDYTQ